MTSDVIGQRASRAGECIDGRYQLETEIGAGGLGSVYRATQTKLARQVAVKLLHEHVGTSDVHRSRFEREARSLASLEHPNIVSILDYGVAADQPYIVTELLEGETLAQRLRAGPLPLEQGLQLADELLDALAFMHEAGVVHRDLKASNVFLQRVHDGERVKLLDFGLAKLTKAAQLSLSAETSRDDTLTRDGSVVGTPAYMSPEQATGDEVDARSDVYAVGVLLYQMLTGRLPFEGDAIDQVRSHLVEPVPALELERSSLAVSSAANGAHTSRGPAETTRLRRLDAALEQLIRRAMAKRREERFANARAMLMALTEVRERGEELQTLPPPAAAATAPMLSARQVLSPLTAAMRVFRVLCVIAVCAQLLLLLWLLRDAEGVAALRKLGERSRVALSQLGEHSSAALRRFSDSGGARSRAEPQATTPPPRRASAGSAGPALIAPRMASDEASAQPMADRRSQPAAADPGRLSQPGDPAESAVRMPPAAATPEPGTTPGTTPSTIPGPTSEGAQQAEALSDTGSQGAMARPRSAADLAVPGPPKARNPWSRPVPAELRGYRKSIVAGGAGDDRVVLALKAYSQSHPGDPRAQLLLGQMYLNRGWRADAVAQLAGALKTDLSARGAPELLASLIELVATGKAEAEASLLIARAYGSEALPALTAKIAGARGEAVGRLKGLRARLDRE